MDLKNIAKQIRIATIKMIVSNMVSDFRPIIIQLDFKRSARLTVEGEMWPESPRE
jgi:hypothetical protein